MFDIDMHYWSVVAGRIWYTIRFPILFFGACIAYMAIAHVVLESDRIFTSTIKPKFSEAVGQMDAVDTVLLAIIAIMLSVMVYMGMWYGLPVLLLAWPLSHLKFRQIKWITLILVVSLLSAACAVYISGNLP